MTDQTSLTYYGHCAFRWDTAAGLRVLADPYRNQYDRYWFTRRFPDVDCDLGLITHAHFDHDASDRLPEAASLLRMPGDFASADLRVRGVQDFHSGSARLRDFPNVMFLVETGGLRFLHIGDNRTEWPDEIEQAVGQVDVLMVTVDDSLHLLTCEQVDSLIVLLQPRVVVPMHYAHPVLTAETSGLEPPDGWLATQPVVRRLESHLTAFSRELLPASTEVWVLQPAPESFSAPETLPEL